MSPLNILQESPHDSQLDGLPGPHSALESTGISRWTPSRYNVRAMTENGQLVLWNTFSGSMSIFKPEQVPLVKSLITRGGIEAHPVGLTKYLVDRGFLLKEGTNEMRRLQLSFGQQHYRPDALQLFLLSSEDCNFRCKYCYEEFARGTMQPRVRTGVRNLIQKRLPGLRRLAISWFGGEPLYGWKAIEDLAPFFMEVAEEHSISLFSHMTTNGYLLTPEVAGKLLSWKINDFQITVDGPPENHNCSRPTREGGPTFQTIFENLKALRDRPDDFFVRIRVNFDKDNHPNLREFLDLVAEEFRDDPRFVLGFFAVGRWGGANDDNLPVCGLDESRQVMKELRRAAVERGLQISGTLKDVKGAGSQVCYAARPYQFIIGASGKVMKCTVALDMQDYNVIGTLEENGDLLLDRDKLAMWTEPAFDNDKKCQKCVVVPSCQGLYCPLVRIEEHRTPCPSSRLNLKADLLEVAQLQKQKVKKVSLSTNGRSASLP